MTDRVRDAVVMDLAAKALQKELTTVHAVHGVLVVAAVATQSGYRLVHPQRMTEREATQLLLYVAEQESDALLKQGSRGEPPPAPPEVARALLLSPSDQVHLLNSAYDQAIAAVRRLEHVLLAAGAAQNYCVAARARGDDLERSKTRHLTGLLQRMKGEADAPE